MTITIKTSDDVFSAWQKVSIENTDFSNLIYTIATTINPNEIEYIDFSFDYIPRDDFTVQLKDKEDTCQTLLALLEEISIELEIFDKVSKKLWYMKKYSCQLFDRARVLRKLEQQIYYCLGNEPVILE